MDEKELESRVLIQKNVEDLIGRVGKLETKISDLDDESKNTKYDIRDIKNVLNNQDKKLDKLMSSWENERKDRDSKNYEWVKFVITTIGGALIMYFLKRAGIV